MLKLVLEYPRSLIDDLVALGIRLPFDVLRADFGGIAPGVGPGDLIVSRVDHKTYVAIDEVGTEAAAATNVGIEPTSSPEAMAVDRPFIFAIRERWSGTILFLGRITSIPTR